MTVSLTSILELSCLIEIVFEKCHLKLILETVKIYEHRIFVILIGFNRYIFRIWTNGIKRSLSSVLTASIIIAHIRSHFVVVLLQYRGVISVIVTKLATATVTFSYCSRAAECGVHTHQPHLAMAMAVSSSNN